MPDSASKFIRSITLFAQDVLSEGGVRLDQVTRRIAVCASLKNPMVGSDRSEPLDELVDLSVLVGNVLVKRAMEEISGGVVRGYGKAAMVGASGELEHGASMIHVRLGMPMRKGAGGGPALIPGNCKMGGLGTPIDIVLGGIDDAWDYDAMDTMTVVVPDAPRADEILLVVAFLVGTRPAARIEGASEAQVRRLVDEIRGTADGGG